MLKSPRRAARLVPSALLGLSCLPFGNAPQQAPAPAGSGTSETLEVLGTYTMGASCGGKFGDDLFLTLLSNHLFTLRQIYRDRACAHQVTVLVLGRWSVASDGRRVTLDAGPPWLRRLDIVNRHTLRIVDPAGPAPPRAGAYQTTQRIRLLPFREPFKLRGLVGAGS